MSSPWMAFAASQSCLEQLLDLGVDGFGERGDLRPGRATRRAAGRRRGTSSTRSGGGCGPGPRRVRRRRGPQRSPSTSRPCRTASTPWWWRTRPTGARRGRTPPRCERCWPARSGGRARRRSRPFWPAPPRSRGRRRRLRATRDLGSGPALVEPAPPSQLGPRRLRSVVTPHTRGVPRREHLRPHRRRHRIDGDQPLDHLVNPPDRPTVTRRSRPTSPAQTRCRPARPSTAVDRCRARCRLSRLVGSIVLCHTPIVKRRCDSKYRQVSS